MTLLQNSNPALDLVAASASQLQRLLSEGTLTSVHLVKECLSQIEKLDRQDLHLNAMISIVPREQLFQIAEGLDRERQAGQLRGPLHGIPIVLKDIINTDPDFELPTTAGSFALKGAENAGNALLVEKLIESGLIVLGKTNLSVRQELQYLTARREADHDTSKVIEGIRCLQVIKRAQSRENTHIIRGEKCICGLSAIGGQVQSNPGGSSSGSAVAVAAGYAPLSIGGEADGSIGIPASRSSLFALKCTPQTISGEGILLIAPTFESIGGMAKTTADLAALIAIILEATWDSLTVGFVDPTKWQLPKELLTSDEDYTLQVVGTQMDKYLTEDLLTMKQKTMYEGAIEKIRSAGGDVHYPVPLVHPSTLQFQGQPGYLMILLSEVRDSVNSYLSTLTSSPMKSLEDIIRFNKEHPEIQAGIGKLFEPKILCLN
ncbi:amidase signature enzyme [Penicillium herquei]|nr:amidase signature enzyme [Penicillium herquei]